MHIIEKKYNYVYITTNLINGKQYVGDHSTNNFNDGYLGSGVKLKHAIKKYKKENFKKQIIEFFETKKEAFDAQEKWIKEYNTIEEGYNISSKGGLGIPGSFHNEETKKKIGLAHKGKIGTEIINYNKKYKKGKTYEEQMAFIYGELEGLEKANLYKQKIKDNTSGNKNPMYGKGIKIEGEKNGMFGKESPRKGKRNTKEQNEKIRLSKIGKERNKKM